jgi:MYXO-CTERM domain-containing protein
MFGNDPNASVFFGSDSHGDGVRIGMADSQRHLSWTGDVGSFDVGLIRIDFPAPDVLDAVRLNRTALDDLAGEPIRSIGFGKHDPDGATDGRKRTGTTSIIDVVAPDVVRTGDADVRVCFGDSGGPALITVDEVEQVAGVHSYTTGEGCLAPNGSTRVDLYAEDFILPWIQANDPVCGADGLCGPIGCEDDPDCAPCGRDGTCTDGCALPDPDCPTSALGEICQADSQCESDLCVYWRDDLEYHYCTRPCEQGGEPCPDGMSCRALSPFGDVCEFDDPPPGVLGDACEAPTDCGSYVCDDGTCVYACDLSLGQRCPADFECVEGADGEAYYCRAVGGDGGGCGCRGGGAGATLGGAGLALLALLATVRRRRRA